MGLPTHMQLVALLPLPLNPEAHAASSAQACKSTSALHEEEGVCTAQAYRQDRILEVRVLRHEEVSATHNHSRLHDIHWSEAQPGLHVARAAVQLDEYQRNEAGKKQAHSNQPPMGLHATNHCLGRSVTFIAVHSCSTGMLL